MKWKFPLLIVVIPNCDDAAIYGGGAGGCVNH
jgi:hypothetical protein